MWVDICVLTCDPRIPKRVRPVEFKLSNFDFKPEFTTPFLKTVTDRRFADLRYEFNYFIIPQTNGGGIHKMALNPVV